MAFRSSFFITSSSLCFYLFVPPLLCFLLLTSIFLLIPAHEYCRKLLTCWVQTAYAENHPMAVESLWRKSIGNIKQDIENRIASIQFKLCCECVRPVRRKEQAMQCGKTGTPFGLRIVTVCHGRKRRRSLLRCKR